MKKTIKVFGLIALAAVIGFSMIGCDNPTGNSSRSFAPSAPRGLTATATSSSEIYLSWNPVSGASGYKVYQSTSSSGTYGLLGTTINTTAVNNNLPANTTVYYKVTAYNSDGESGYSNTASATTLSSTVSVTGVSLNPTSLTINVGNTATLTATVSPSNATDKRVAWASGNTNVARVNDDGVVTGVSTGTTTIAVATVDGQYTATCTVTVIYSLDGRWLRQDNQVGYTISGASGTFTRIDSNSSLLYQDARNKNYISIGGPAFRNISPTSAGALTFSGQIMLVTFSGDTALGSNWNSFTMTVAANGMSFNVYAPNAATPNMSFTRY